MMLIILTIILLYLCWGSFLNVLAHRFVFGHDIVFKRSFCINCKTTLSVLDLIPILSWIILERKCRYCKKPISLLYPAIEFLSALLLTLMFVYLPPQYFISYTLFISSLIITIRTDIETLLISRFTTLYIIPAAYIFSYFNLLPINLFNSIFSTFLGYFILWFTNKIFHYLKKIDGIGEGDFELLATIGAFTGFMGIWASLLIGSFLGAVIGLFFYYKNKLTPNTQIPFAPLLAIGALIYIFISQSGYLTLI